MSNHAQLDRDAMFALIEAIAARHLPPSEKPVVEATGRELIDQCLDSGPQTIVSASRTKIFDFGPGALADLQFLSVLLGTSKAALEVWKWKADNRHSADKRKEAVERWKKRLTEAGVDAGQADKIVADFQDDFLKLGHP